AEARQPGVTSGFAKAATERCCPPMSLRARVTHTRARRAPHALSRNRHTEPTQPPRKRHTVTSIAETSACAGTLKPPTRPRKEPFDGTPRRPRTARPARGAQEPTVENRPRRVPPRRPRRAETAPA